MINKTTSCRILFLLFTSTCTGVSGRDFGVGGRRLEPDLEPPDPDKSSAAGSDTSDIGSKPFITFRGSSLSSTGLGAGRALGRR